MFSTLSCADPAFAAWCERVRAHVQRRCGPGGEARLHVYSIAGLRYLALDVFTLDASHDMSITVTLMPNCTTLHEPTGGYLDVELPDLSSALTLVSHLTSGQDEMRLEGLQLWLVPGGA